MYSSPSEPGSSDERVYDLFSRGVVLLRGGHPHQAAVVLRRAKLLEPDKTSIREALGRALYMSGRTLGARLEFARVVQLDPCNDYAHFALALACERTGARARGIGHLKLALAMRPGTTYYEHALARMAS